jgi:DNA-binding MarR family transcriptional regulator
MQFDSETEALAGRFQDVFEQAFRRVMHDQAFKVGHVFKSMTMNQMRALHILYRDAGVLQRDLAEKLGITPAAISPAIRDLENQGLVIRQRDEADARSMRLHLSDVGRELIEQNLALRRRALMNLFKEMTHDEQLMIVQAFERALAHMEATPPDTE